MRPVLSTSGYSWSSANVGGRGRVRHHAGSPVGVIEPTIGEQPRRSLAVLPRSLASLSRHRPPGRGQVCVALLAQPGQSAEIECARAVVPFRAQARMLVEDLGDARVVESGVKTQPLRDLADHPPIRPGHGGRRQEIALARNMPIRVRDRALLFSPRRRRQQYVRESGGIGLRHAVGCHDERTASQRLTCTIGVREADDGIGADDPDRFDLSAMHRLEQVDGFEAGPPRNARRSPKILHDAPMLRVLQFHVGGQRVGEPTHLASTHRVRLAGNGKRSGSGPTDSPRQ